MEVQYRESEPVTKRRRRRLHISCLACAKSRRKCTRERPCGNCSMRKIECVYETLSHKQREEEKLSSSASLVNKEVTEGTDVLNEVKPEVERTYIVRDHYSAKLQDILNDEVIRSDEKIREPQWTSSQSGESVTAESSVTPNSPGYKVPPSNYSYRKDFNEHIAKNEDCVPANESGYIIRVGVSDQRIAPRYYGPSSGPSLLLCQGLHPIKEENRSRFPKELVPDFDDLIGRYHHYIHWFVGCFEWSMMLEWVSAENVPECNSVVWEVLAIACLTTGDSSRAFQYHDMGYSASPSCAQRVDSSDISLILTVLRIVFSQALGRFEEMWLYLGLGINMATSMGYHRQWPQFNGSVDKRHTLYNRTWLSLVEMDRKLALLLGRPYNTNREFYDCSPPTSEYFQYDSTMRDHLNKLSPVYAAVIEETFSKEPNQDRLERMNDEVIEWDSHIGMDNQFVISPKELEAMSAETKERMDKLITTQQMFLHSYRYFLSSRIFRVLMAIDTKSSLPIVKFSEMNWNFAQLALKIVELGDLNMGLLTDLVAFTVDNVLFSLIKMRYSNYSVKCNGYAKSALEDSKKLLEYSIGKLPSSTSMAQQCLKIVKATEASYLVMDPLNNPLKMTHPLESEKLDNSVVYGPMRRDSGVTPWTSSIRDGDGANEDPAKVQQFQQIPTSFNLNEWDNWLKEFLD